MKNVTIFDLYHDIQRLTASDGKTYGATLSEGLQRIKPGFFNLYHDIFSSLPDRFEK